MNFTIDQSDEVDKNNVDAMVAILNRNNLLQGFPWETTPVSLSLRDENGVSFGGLSGSTSWGWLHVELLAVDESLRGCGYGTMLLNAAEEIARQRRCSHVYLDTFSFQSRGFYEKQGYEVFGTLNDYPVGASRYFMTRSL